LRFKVLSFKVLNLKVRSLEANKLFENLRISQASQDSDKDSAFFPFLVRAFREDELEVNGKLAFINSQQIIFLRFETNL
jgi:hypothetical protein